MILADKLISLRKKNGWSQEDLADRLGVSRQSVSKWESAASTPDMNKLLDLSRLFGVTTDYLLKDDLTDEEYTDHESELLARVSLADAQDFFAKSRFHARRVALGVLLCILGAAFLIACAGLGEGLGALREELAAGIGVAGLLVLVAIAVAIFITSGFALKDYEFLEKGAFEAEYGVTGLAAEQKAAFFPIYSRNITVGVVLCILAVVPLVLAGCLGAADAVCIGLTVLLLVLIGAAVYLFVFSGMVQDSFEQLLRQGDYAPEQRERQRLGSIYWPIVTALYLGVSFLTRRWDISWVVWPVAGLLYAALCAAFQTGARRG